MNAFLSLFFILCLANATAQNLKNTEWIQLSVQTRDGKVVYELQPGKQSVKYYFLEDSVLVSSDEQYSNKVVYAIDDGILMIGKFTSYIIDSLNERTLVVSDFPQKGDKNKKLSTRTLLNTDYLFDYLRQTQQLPLLGDSMVVANNLFSPTYNGDLWKLFLDKISPLVNRDLPCNFTISKDGNICEIQISSNKKFTNKEIKKISEIISSTQGSWVIPPTPKKFSYRMNFVLQFLTGGIRLSFHQNK